MQRRTTTKTAGSDSRSPRRSLGGWSGVALAGCLGAAVLAWSFHEEPSPDLQTWMTGSFVVDERPDDIDRRLGAAIERVVAPLGQRFRPIARGRLSQLVDYCRGYQMSLSVREVRVRCDDAPPIAHRLRTPDATDRVEIEPDAVVLALGDGERTTTYRFDSEGDLEVRVQLSSEQLERPLDWRIRYRRVGAPPAPPVSAASLEPGR